MLNISSILLYVHDNIGDSDRFKVINDEHVLDIKTGVEYHLYDDWFKLTHNDKVLAEMKDFTQSEKEIVWKIKSAITEPDVAKKKEENYFKLVGDNRALLASAYEYPEPVKSKTVIEEDDTEDYAG